MDLLRRHLSAANVLSCLALFVSLSGIAYAATAGRNSVKTVSIVTGAVTTPKLHKKAVTTAKLRDEAVTEDKLKDRAVGGNKIGRAAITDFQLAPDAVGAGKILDGSITATEISEVLLKQIVKKVSYGTKASESSTGVAPKSVFVECPFGKQAIGGGAQVVGNTTGVAITKSVPGVGVGGPVTSWSATAAPIAAEPNPWAVEAFVICAES
jgi:hypothetical protein